MSTEKMSLRATIEPKSDQLNYDDVAAGPMTVTVKTLRAGSKDQPVIVDVGGGRPYKPCKSMRRVLIATWGERGREWIGKRMTLCGDPKVVFGGVEVGGIRISHVSGITEPLKILLTTTRSKRSEYVVRPLPLDRQEAPRQPAGTPADAQPEPQQEQESGDNIPF